MSQSTNDIIDLTEESSLTAVQRHSAAPTTYAPPAASSLPPRSNRIVIDIEEQNNGAAPFREESPEIEFLTSRPRSSSQSRRRNGFAPTVRSPTQNLHTPIRVSAAERVPQHIPRPWQHALQNLQFPTPSHHRLREDRDEEEAAFDNFPNDFFQAPEQLNFLQAAFNYEQPSRPQHQAPLPAYEVPPLAQRGFTRSPGEDDVLVCPHCNDELGLGEHEEKRQVWVVKTCGHVRFLDFVFVLS